MMLTTDAPDQLLYDGMIPGAFTGDGCVLENVEDVPAGPWLAIVLDSIEPSRLTSWEIPAYLRACARVEAWAAARKTAAVAELASRMDAVGPDKEVALALREPVGAAQTRVHFSRRLRRLLPQTPAELRRDARDALTRCDPAGAQQRSHTARDQADVALHPNEDGMADVVVHAPVEQQH
jgi:hypothetical protein